MTDRRTIDERDPEFLLSRQTDDKGYDAESDKCPLSRKDSKTKGQMRFIEVNLNHFEAVG